MPAKIAEEYQKVQNDLKRVSGEMGTYAEQSQKNYDNVSARLQAVEQIVVDGPIDRFKSHGGQESERPAFSVKIGNERFPALRNDQRLTSFSSHDIDEPEFNLSDFVKAGLGLIRPTAAVTSNSGLVPSYTSSSIVDDVRAASTIVRAGALTIPIGGPTNLCRVDGDVAVHQHTEGLTDVSESQPTFAPILLEPKALVASVPISAELVADSENLEEALRVAISGAFAAKLDSLAVAKILADTAIPMSLMAQDPATWAGVLSAVGSALTLDQLMPKAHVGSEVDFIARAGQTDTGGAWLNRPEALKEMLELFTTKLDAGTAIFGDFTGFGIALRQDLRLELLRYHGPASYSHLLVCHARAEGYVLQPKKLFIQQAVVSA